MFNMSFGVEGTVYVPVEVIDDFTEGFVYLPCAAYQGMASSDYTSTDGTNSLHIFGGSRDILFYNEDEETGRDASLVVGNEGPEGLCSIEARVGRSFLYLFALWLCF